jgi:hypothetical protein
MITAQIAALLSPTNDGFLADCYQFAQSLAPSDTAADFSAATVFFFGPEAAPAAGLIVPSATSVEQAAAQGMYNPRAIL